MQEKEISLEGDNNPLRGIRIVVTRPLNQSLGFCSDLTGLGSQVIQMPTVKICGLEDHEHLDKVVGDARQFDWVIFTSGNAVRYFAESAKRQGVSFGGDGDRTKVCCVGEETARISKSFGFDVASIPTIHTGKGIVELFESQGDLDGKSFLIPSSSEATATVSEGLRNLGGSVNVVPAYETVPVLEVPDHILADVRTGVDLLTFTSPSTVKSFHQLVRGEVTAPVAVIGPVTAAEAEKLGYEIAVHPKEYSMSDLLEAIVRYFLNNGKG